MDLFFRESGIGPHLVILHGLLGSSDNWLTQAKLFAGDYRVWLVDLRNHGRSPHSGDMNYDVMAADVLDLLSGHGITDPVLIGHSMGGKVAMHLALTRQAAVKALVVVDIAPKAYPVQHDELVHSLMRIDVNALQTRKDADQVLSNEIPEPALRQFLLKNLTRTDEGKYAWKANLPVIERNLEKLSADIGKSGASFQKPVLFISGQKSDYIAGQDESLIKQLFPLAHIVKLNTGHWVQAENPQAFFETVKTFLDTNA